MSVDFFLRRPVLSSVLALLIIAAGALCLPTLPISEYPQLAPPVVSVSSLYVGADAATVETTVTSPLEQALNGVPGMRFMTSSSANDGTSNIQITFEVDRDVDIAAVDVQNRINQVLGRLPDSVRRLGVTVGKNSGSFVLALAIFAEKDEYTTEFLSNYADVYVKNAVKRLKGVSEVQIFGERKYAMRIWIDPVRLASRGMVPRDVVAALAEQNAEFAPGQVGGEPGPTSRVLQLSVRASGRLSTAQEFENVVLKTGEDGAFVRVADVARVELGAEDYSSRIRYNGKEAVGLGIMQLPGGNALDIARDVKAAVGELSREFPPGMRYAVAFDTTGTIDESINEVLKTLAEAILLVVLVMFVFLQSGRATLIPAVTIPVSLIGTFAVVKLLGFSINTLTLFGITLATGLVVDDAIVVVENVERHLRGGAKPIDATSLATREVVGAVIATSLVLVAVFVPVAFYPGVTGRLYRQFALTIAASVSLSALNSLTLTPALSAILLRAHEGSTGVLAAFDRGFQRLNARYERAVGWAFAKKPWVFGAYVLCAAGAYVLLTTLPQSFAPQEDKGWFMVGLSAPEGSSVNRTIEIVKRVEASLKETPEVNGVFSLTGWDFAGANPARGFFFINLKPLDERRGTEHGVDAVVGRVREKLFGIEGANVFAFTPPSIDVGGLLGNLQFQMIDRTGGDMGRFSSVLQGLLDAASADPHLVGVYSGFSASEPQLRLKVDRDKAKRLNVSLGDLRDTVQVAVGSVYVGDFDFNNRAYRVLAQADGPARATPQDIDSLYVRNTRMQLVSLGALTQRSWITAPSTIGHYNLFRAIDASGSPAPGVSSGDAIAALERVAAQALPAGFSVTWTGLSLEEIESRGKAAAIFGLCFVFVFLLLSALYESFVLPFVIMLSVPVAAFGAFLGVRARGLENDVFCQIGLVMLIALASKNAILVVEFAEKLRAEGRSLVAAATEAAAIRLRPILMTSFAFVFGVLPLVLASGAGAGSRRSLGTTVAAGMLVSTLLNSFFVPLLYVLVMSLRRSVAPVLAATAILLVALPANGATLMSFEDAIVAARKNHASLKTAEANLRRADALLRRTQATALPGLGVNGIYTRLDHAREYQGQVVIPADAFNGNLTLTVPLLAPAAWEGWVNAKRGTQMASYQFDDTSRRVALGVARAYFAAVTASSVIEVERRALAVAERHLEQADLRAKAGLTKALDVIRAEQQVQDARVRVRRAETTVQRTEEALGLAIGADGSVTPNGVPSFAVSRDGGSGMISRDTANPRLGDSAGAPSPGPPPAPEADLSPVLERPDLRRVVLRADAADSHLKHSWTLFTPTLSAAMQLYTYSPPAFGQPPIGWQLTLTVSFPIYDGGLRYAEMASRRAERADAAADRISTELNAKSEWRLAQAQIGRLQDVLVAQKRAAELATSALKTAEAAYGVGTTTSLDVTDSEQRARDAASGVVSVENELRAAEIEWLFAIGQFPP